RPSALSKPQPRHGQSGDPRRRGSRCDISNFGRTVEGSAAAAARPVSIVNSHRKTTGTNSHRKITGTIAAGAVTGGLVAGAGLGLAPAANATCVSIFGIGGGADCSSTLLS